MFQWSQIVMDEVMDPQALNKCSLNKFTTYFLRIDICTRIRLRTELCMNIH